MGNVNSSSQVGNLYIQTDQAFYIAGDTVTGKVHVNTFESYPANVLQIKVKGYEESYWQEEHTREQQNNGTTSLQKYFETHKGKNVFYSHMFPLYVWSGFSYMPAGQYTFPFQFKLQETLPGTYFEKGVERGGEYKAVIKYKVKAEISAMSHTKLKSKQELIVREPLKTIVSSQYGEKLVKPSTWCCISQGESHIRCCFERNNYQPGETARMNAEIDNSNCKLDVTNLNCNFTKLLRLSSSAGRELRISKTVQTREFNGVPAGQRATEQNKRNVEVDLKDKHGPIQPSTHGRLVNCEYTLNVTARLEGCICCSPVPEVTVPITIVSPPPVNYGVVTAPPNWQPQVFEVKSFTFSSDCMYSKSLPPPPTGNVNVTMNMPIPTMHVNMNVPAPKVHVNTTTSHSSTSQNVNMNMGMGVPSMNVKVSGTNTAHHSENVNMNMNMGFGAPSMNVKVTGNNTNHHQENVSMNMGFGGPSMNVNVNGGNNHHNNNGPDHVNISVGGHDNSGFGMNLNTNTNAHHQDGFGVNFSTNDSHDNMFGNNNNKNNADVNMNFQFNGNANFGNHGNDTNNPFG